MTIKLKPSTEESTYIATISFFETNGTAVAPKLVQWTLKDQDGAVVNGREEVNVDVPGATIVVVLTGDDLSLPDATRPNRYLLIEAIYDSVLYGNDLNLREEAQFAVSNLVAKV